MNTKSLTWKYGLAFMLVPLLTILILLGVLRFTSANQFTRFLKEDLQANLESELLDYYQSNGSWEGVAENWMGLNYRAIPTPMPPPPEEAQPPAQEPATPIERQRRSFFGLADANGVVLVALEPDFPAGKTLGAAELKQFTSLVVEGQNVGTILFRPLPPERLSKPEQDYLQRVNRALVFAGLGALVAAVLMGILLARRLIRPLQRLTAAAEGIAGGSLEQQVAVDSRDEVGRLAEAFNRMSREVARVNRLRRQMTADIAHDLRTPLTVISGYIESMRDGVLEPTPERLDLISTEIDRLQKLIDDLRLLSLADAGELPLVRQPLAPAALLERAAAVFRMRAAQQGVALQVDAPAGLPEVLADEARLMQVFSNLLANALRYTPQGGSVTLSAAQNGAGQVAFSVEDTGCGVDPADLPHLFERFYRADASRHAESGESGLGLSIVKALVEAHGGQVWAESAPGRGAALRFTLQLAEEGDI